MKKLFEQTLLSETVYKGPVVEVQRDLALLESGVKATRDVINHPGGVCVVPIDEAGNIYMVRQFRYPFRCVLEEIPAGKIDFGENPAECGRRELLEEIGAEAESFESLGTLYPTPAYDTEVIHMFLARGLKFSGQDLDDDEFLEVFTLEFSKAVEKVLAGELPDAKTQIAILKAREHIER